MKEITTMPVRVQNGNKEIEVYEYSDGFAMTTEYLGRCIGFKNPQDGMAYLFRRNKEALDPHRFLVTVTKNPLLNQQGFPVTVTGNPLGGRPTNFYDSEGCVLAASFARTPEAKVFLPMLLAYLEALKAKRMARIEAYWFGIRPFWPEIRDRVMQGQGFRMIAEAMGRSAASVRNAVRRMIEVGILQAMRAAQALTGTGRKAVLRYDGEFFKRSTQLALPGFDVVTT